MVYFVKGRKFSLNGMWGTLFNISAYSCSSWSSIFFGIYHGLISLSLSLSGSEWI